MNLKFLKAGALTVTLALASLTAHADTYNFSYTFDGSNTSTGDTVVLTGFLTGTLNGSFIENVSDVHVFLNGTEFSSPLYAEGWNASGSPDSTVAPVISTDAALNNFIFADTDVSTDPDALNYFWFTSGQAFAVNFQQLDAGNNALTAYDSGASNANWSLVAAPVPEPGPYALLAAGLGLTGAVARRRQA